MESTQRLWRGGTRKLGRRDRKTADGLRVGFVLLLLTLFGGAAAPATAAPDDASLAEIGAIVRDEIAAGHVPGAVVVVGHRGKIVYRAAFGARAVRPKRIAMRPDAVFDIASLTKVVATTTAVMQLVETGRLRLDEPVATVWPEFAAAGKDAITVRQLLSHTSGLRPDLDENASWTGEAAALV